MATIKIKTFQFEVKNREKIINQSSQPLASNPIMYCFLSFLSGTGACYKSLLVLLHFFVCFYFELHCATPQSDKTLYQLVYVRGARLVHSAEAENAEASHECFAKNGHNEGGYLGLKRNARILRTVPQGFSE